MSQCGSAIKHPMELLTWDLLESWPPHLLLKISLARPRNEWTQPCLSYWHSHPTLEPQNHRQGSVMLASGTQRPAEVTWKVGGPVDGSSICTPATRRWATMHLSRQGSRQLPLERWNEVTAANPALLPPAAAARSTITEHMLQDVHLTPFISIHIRTNTPLELGFTHGSSVRLSSSH